MRNELIPKVLKEYRKINNYSVNDVSIKLQEHSYSVAPKTIYGWESGQAQPSADVLLALCEIYNVTNILSTFGYEDPKEFHLTAQEQELVRAYRAHPEMHEPINILLHYDDKETSKS